MMVSLMVHWKAGMMVVWKVDWLVDQWVVRMVVLWVAKLVGKMAEYLDYDLVGQLVG